MDISIFLDNLTKGATRQVFSSSLSAVLTQSELSGAQEIFEQENIIHQIEEGGAIRFKHKGGDYLLVPETVEPAIAEPVAAPTPAPKAKPVKKEKSNG